MSKYWSGEVTKHSNALDLEEGVFKWDDPKKIAKSLKNSAEASLRRKAKPFQSAMSMLNFYMNRAGKNLKPERKIVLEKAKEELRRLFQIPKIEKKLKIKYGKILTWLLTGVIFIKNTKASG